jgi:hypothetical protein
MFIKLLLRFAIAHFLVVQSARKYYSQNREATSLMVFLAEKLKAPGIVIRALGMN